MSERRIRAVVSDWDDTKVATFSWALHFHQEFARRHSLPVPSEENLRALWGEPWIQVVQRLHSTHQDPEELVAAIRNFRKVYTIPHEPFPTTKAAVLTLRNMRLTQGIISSGPRASILRTLEEHLHLPDDTYHFVHGSENSSHHKPDPRVFTPALERLHEVGIDTREMVYVGDHLKDTQASAALGIVFIAVTTGITTEEDFCQEGVPSARILRSFAEVPELILGWMHTWI